jgi:hypothetical protein
VVLGSFYFEFYVFFFPQWALVAFKPTRFWFVCDCDSRHQFSSWCCHKYGPEALQIATTVKLARAWIICCFDYCNIFKKKSTKIKIPYFIGLFILAMILNTIFLQQRLLVLVYSLQKLINTVTLF